MAAYKVLVCGARDYEDRDKVFHILDALHARVGHNLMIISGGAPGADELAREWAVSRKVDHQVYYAKWRVFHKQAGPIRNRRMGRKKLRWVFAFHPNLAESRGTADMIKVATDRGVKVKKFR